MLTFNYCELFFYRLAKKLKDSKQSKEGLAQEIKNKQEYLENLQPKLKTVLEVRSICIVNSDAMLVLILCNVSLFPLPEHQLKKVEYRYKEKKFIISDKFIIHFQVSESKTDLVVSVISL